MNVFGVHCTGADGGDDKHFTDRAVCRPFLLDICISDLFTNTVRETSYLFAQSLIAALMGVLSAAWPTNTLCATHLHKPCSMLLLLLHHAYIYIHHCM